MSTDELHRRSFIIRIWMEPQEQAPAPMIWRGMVEEVSSGDRKYFINWLTLVQILKQYIGESDIQDSKSEDG